MAIANGPRTQTLKVSVSDSESSDEVEDSENENSSDDDIKSNEGDMSIEKGDVSDNEGDVSDSEGDVSNNEDVLIKNEGWADSISKILSSSKPKNKRTLVLSRAKKLADVKKKENQVLTTFEVVGDDDDVKPDTLIPKSEIKTDEPPAKKKKQDKSSIRIKPNVLEKDRERVLSKIATKGVVQLFNAVRNQQKTFEKELNNDIPEGKKEKILKKFDKRAFLDTLMGQTKSVVVDEASKTFKDEIKAEEKPRWNALRDDFMMGAKMKDWDKESVDE